MSRTVNRVCIVLILQSTPSLHVSAYLSLVYIRPSRLFFHSFSDMIFEAFPVPKVGGFAQLTRNDEQVVSIRIFPCDCKGHCTVESRVVNLEVTIAKKKDSESKTRCYNIDNWVSL
jgi:hypothetical protein